MTEEEKKAVCELKNYITKRKRSYTKLDRHDKAINNLLNLIGNLQKENTEFEKLSKNYSYSVDIVRENTRLRRQVFDLELENEELKILKSGIQTLQDLRIEDGKYIVMSKNDFLNGSCKHLLDDYISKQEIKNIIDKIDYDIKKTNEIIENGGISSYQVFMLSKINTKSSNIKERLQKLLESEE